MTGKAEEFVVELVVCGKGVNYAPKGVGKAIKGLKGLKETEAFAKMSEATSKAITTINEFVKASKLGKLAESIKGIFKVGQLNLMNKVKFGLDDLSKFAIDFRKTLPFSMHRGNVAVFEYIDNEGILTKKAFTTEIGSQTHAERIADSWFESNKIPKKILNEYIVN